MFLNKLIAQKALNRCLFQYQQQDNRLMILLLS